MENEKNQEMNYERAIRSFVYKDYIILVFNVRNKKQDERYCVVKTNICFEFAFENDFYEGFCLDIVDAKVDGKEVIKEIIKEHIDSFYLVK